MPADPFYRTPAWRQLRDKRRRLAKAAAEPCHRCGADIDYTLKAGPWSPTIDHITARRLGGEQLPRLDDLAPAHRRCNSIHGAHVTAAVKAAKKAQQPTTAATAPQPPYRAAPPAPSAPQAATGVFRAGRAAPRGGATVITPKVTTNTAGDAGVLGGECGQPRFLSPQHPNAVGTLADEWLPWIESPAGAGITLRPWQRVVLRRALEVDADGLLCWRTVVVSTPRQSGKDLDCATPMLTANRGWTTTGELVAGDVVFGPDGGETEVVAAHDAEMAPFGAYRVTLTDGRSLVAGGEHLWRVTRYGRSWVVTTAQLAAAGLRRARTTVTNGVTYQGYEYLWRVPSQEPVKMPDRDLLVDPYLLGYWLGDGTSVYAQVTVDPADAQGVRDAVAAAGYVIISEKPNTGSDALCIWVSTLPKHGNTRRDSLQRRLRTLGVLGNKHIPGDYLAAGLDQRLALLRGLMDSDGSVSRTGSGATRCEFSSTDEALARDVYCLVLSLGFRATIREGEARLSGRYISQRWRIGFSVVADDPNPFTLPRKRDAVRRTTWRKHPSIKSIERVPDRMMRCITVDRHDGMFLAGRDLVPTHNSWLARAAITARCHHGPGRWAEPQECLHVANALVAARRIQAQAWRWAEGADLDVRRAFGAERIIWPDGSHWSLVATKSVWGASGSMVYGDEAWDIGVDEIEQGVVPTMLERTSPQLWLSSTANDDATPLMTGYRAEGIAGSGSVMVAEWSVPLDADADDPATWRRWLAHWTPQREEFMTQARGKPSFRSQYLNQWPAEVGESLRQWPAGWTAAPRVGQPVAGGVAALESTVNREFYGTAYAVAGADGSVSLWTARHRTLEEASAWVSARSPGRAVVGLSLAKEVVLAAPTEHYGSSHTVLATPVLEDLVRRGLLRHDHSEVTAEQTRHARVIQSERGLYMSGKASRGAIETLKAAAWAAWTATLPALEMPAVW